MHLHLRALPYLIVTLLFMPLSLEAEGNPGTGKRLYQNQCASCHVNTSESGPTGPSLLGVFGRTAGSLKDFAYSDPMKKSGIVWSEETLLSYLAAPLDKVPGTTMTASVSNPQERANITAFLKNLKPAE